MEILETKGRKMNKIKREEREDLHTFLDTTFTDICPDFRSIDSYVVLPYKPNILLIHSILSCKLFAHICKFLYLYIINLADIYA